MEGLHDIKWLASAVMWSNIGNMLIVNDGLNTYLNAWFAMIWKIELLALNLDLLLKNQNYFKLFYFAITLFKGLVCQQQTAAKDVKKSLKSKS